MFLGLAVYANVLAHGCKLELSDEIIFYISQSYSEAKTVLLYYWNPNYNAFEVAGIGYKVKFDGN